MNILNVIKYKKNITQKNSYIHFHVLFESECGVLQDSGMTN